MNLVAWCFECGIYVLMICDANVCMVINPRRVQYCDLTVCITAKEAPANCNFLYDGNVRGFKIPKALLNGLSIVRKPDVSS